MQRLGQLKGKKVNCKLMWLDAHEIIFFRLLFVVSKAPTSYDQHNYSMPWTRKNKSFTSFKSQQEETLKFIEKTDCKHSNWSQKRMIQIRFQLNLSASAHTKQIVCSSSSIAPLALQHLTAYPRPLITRYWPRLMFRHLSIWEIVNSRVDIHHESLRLRI